MQCNQPSTLHIKTLNKQGVPLYSKEGVVVDTKLGSFGFNSSKVCYIVLELGYVLFLYFNPKAVSNADPRCHSIS